LPPSVDREEQLLVRAAWLSYVGGLTQAQIAKRLVWGEVVALGPNVRSAEAGDRVLFSPDDRYEVEVQGEDYIMLRERDLHALAAKRIEASTGLYL
jgi:chaperonin GroES